MKKTTITIIGLVLAAIVAWYVLGIYVSLNTFQLIHDGKTDGADERNIQSTAEDVARLITDESWENLYLISSEETRASANSDEYVLVKQRQYDSVVSISDIEIAEIIVVKMKKSNRNGNLFQTISPSKILPPAIQLTSPISGRQAFVLCTAITDDGDWPSWISILLKQEGTKWRFFDYIVGSAKVGGRDGHWFWTKAKEFGSAGQHRNAHFYTEIASVLLSPSDIIKSVSTRKIIDELSEQSPSNIPFPGKSLEENWKINEDLTVTVYSVHSIVTGSILWLEVRYRTSLQAIQSAEAKAERQQVYDYIIKTFPEYKDAFGGIFIGSVKENGQGNRDGFPFDTTGPSQVPKWFDTPESEIPNSDQS